MTKYAILALAVAAMVLCACGGRNKEEAAPAPTPTAVPALSSSAATTEKAAESEPADTDEAGQENSKADNSEEPAAAAEEMPPARAGGGQQRGMGGGMGPAMRERHMAPVPAEYAGLASPVTADAGSIARGQAHFNQFCASCHGNEGLGDGPAAASLDPAPPMIAQTSLMLGDDFLFWRISEGGAFDPFNSAMPAWKAILDEEARWDIINYARTLGGSESMTGNGAMREEMQAAMHDEMLAAGMEQGVIDEADAETFLRLHDRIDAYRATVEGGTAANMDEMLPQLLADMVAAGELSQADADAFDDIHARLTEAGLMP